MRIEGELLEARFLRRLNRFACLVDLAGKEETVYLANSGRLKDILSPGRTVFVVDRSSSGRKTKYDLTMVSLKEGFASVDARVPHKLFQEALDQGKLSCFHGYSVVRREVPFHRSKLDFLVRGEEGQCYVELKSVTLVRNGRALFPDAPTSRGRRHLEDLIVAKTGGHDAAVVFIVQREVARCFSPDDEIDPAFGQALRKAHSQGVKVFSYRCRVGLEEIEISDQLEICL